MTELEIMQRAKMYMDKLAQGIDPITGNRVPEDTVLNQQRLSRCFLYVSDVLGKVIANGGTVGERTTPFAITKEQLSRVQLSQEPIRVSQLMDRISAATGDPQMKKLPAKVVTDWLVEKGFLEIQMDANGKSKRIPTPKGQQIGIFQESVPGKFGEYISVFYQLSAQRFLLENLYAMLEEKRTSK